MSTMSPPSNPRPLPQSQARRFTTNVISNLALLVLNVVLGIWFTSYLIGELGVALFGFITLATSMTIYMGIITTSLNSALGRFLTIDLSKGNHEQANLTFNSAFWASTLIALGLIPMILVVAWFAPVFF